MRARIGGAAGLFLLDTGAPVTVLDQAFARAAGVQAESEEMIVGVGGARVAARAKAAALTLEGGPAARVEASITDLSPVAARMAVPLTGVLGGDFLSGFVLTLDYRRGAVGLAAAPPTGPDRRRSAADRAHALCPRHRRPRSRTGAGEFQIDTGANTAVVFWRPFAERAFPGAGAVSGAVQGVAGVSQARIGRLTALEIAGQRLVDLQANFADEVRPDDAGRDHAGVIGGPAFAGRRITIDYPGQRFWFA